MPLRARGEELVGAEQTNKGHVTKDHCIKLYCKISNIDEVLWTPRDQPKRHYDLRSRGCFRSQSQLRFVAVQQRMKIFVVRRVDL